MTMLRTGFAVDAFDLERVAVFRIRTVGVVTGAHAQVLDEHVGRLDLDAPRRES